jgi:hypothetical protein
VNLNIEPEDELKRTQLTEIVQDITLAAHETASPRLRSALRDLHSLSENTLLSEDLRNRAQAAALRVAEAAMQIENLLLAIDAEKANGHRVPSSARGGDGEPGACPTAAPSV